MNNQQMIEELRRFHAGLKGHTISVRLGDLAEEAGIPFAEARGILTEAGFDKQGSAGFWRWRKEDRELLKARRALGLRII